jgi:hypothetical protein
MLLALGGMAMLAVAACSSGTHHASPPTTSLAPSTVAAPDADIVPPVITVAYVNAVLAVLNHVYGNATRALVASRRMTPDVRADLRSIYNDPAYGQQLSAAQLSLTTVITNVRLHPGDPVILVKKLMSAAATCVFFEATTDLSKVLVHPTPSAASEYFELARKQPGGDPRDLNQTRWAISFNVAYLAPTTIGSRCTGG